jgi:hypothetical protein
MVKGERGTRTPNRLDHNQPDGGSAEVRFGAQLADELASRLRAGVRKMQFGLKSPLVEPRPVGARTTASPSNLESLWFGQPNPEEIAP